MHKYPKYNLQLCINRFLSFIKIDEQKQVPDLQVLKYILSAVLFSRGVCDVIFLHNIFYRFLLNPLTFIQCTFFCCVLLYFVD